MSEEIIIVCCSEGTRLVKGRGKQNLENSLRIWTLISKCCNYPDTKNDETEASVILCQVVGVQPGQELEQGDLKVHSNLENLWTFDEYLLPKVRVPVYLSINPSPFICALFIHLSIHLSSLELL